MDLFSSTFRLNKHSLKLERRNAKRLTNSVSFPKQITTHYLLNTGDTVEIPRRNIGRDYQKIREPRGIFLRL